MRPAASRCLVPIPLPDPGKRPAARRLLAYLLLLGCAAALHGAHPRHGLATLPTRPLVFGYLNELRTTNSPAWTLSQLDYDAVDLVIYGFAEP